jgi:hypothetical protein
MSLCVGSGDAGIRSAGTGKCGFELNNNDAVISTLRPHQPLRPCMYQAKRPGNRVLTKISSIAALRRLAGSLSHPARI